MHHKHDKQTSAFLWCILRSFWGLVVGSLSIYISVTFQLPKCATLPATDVRHLNYIQWMLITGIFIVINYMQFLFFCMWEWNECKKTKPLVLFSWGMALTFEILEFAWFTVGTILFFSTIWTPACRQQNDVLPWWGLLLFIGHLVLLFMKCLIGRVICHLHKCAQFTKRVIPLSV